MRTVYIFNTGCTRLSLDRARLESYFRFNNCKVIKSPKEAEIILLLTCAFDLHCEDVSVKAVSSLKKYRGEIIIGGCLPEINKSRMQKIHSGRFITTKEIDGIDTLFPEFKVSYKNIPDGNTPVFPSILENFRIFFSFSCYFFKGSLTKVLNYLQGFKGLKVEDRACLRISRGCLGNCSFCVINKAIGTLKSKSIREIVSELNKLRESGNTHISIISDDTGAYGLDIGENLPNLLNTIISLHNDIFIRLTAFHPKWLLLYKNEILDLVSKGSISSIRCPIQSGSERILNLMDRKIDLEELKSALIELKTSNPNFKLSTAVIAGFPSETEEEFRDTLNFITDVRFDYVMFFYFASKMGTGAAKIEPKIDYRIIKQRIKFGIRRLRKEKILARAHNYSPEQR